MLRAAVILADEGGIESLSMRKLGEKVGRGDVAVQHVANKEDILNGIVDLVVSEINVVVSEIDVSSSDWKAARASKGPIGPRNPPASPVGAGRHRIAYQHE